VAAEHRKIVDGLEINIGIVPVPQMMRVDAYERAMHRGTPSDATHHVVVGVADVQGGTPVRDARVTLDGSARRTPGVRLP
jgi:mannose/fructose-specific phosphotransferase system component IIA